MKENETEMRLRSGQMPCCERARSRAPIALTLLIVMLIAAGSCSRPGAAVKAKHVKYSTTQWSEELFSFAVANLNHLEDNDCVEMLRSMEERLEALRNPKAGPGVVQANALLASWPEPDMLRQVVSRLNQWVDTLDKPDPWKPDPMLAALAAKFSKLPMASNAELGQDHFTSYDSYALMEAVWARDVARWAKGNTSDDLPAARNLFDWTVRNIQLDPDGPGHIPQVPWETLFLGHGTAMERAWIYILLLRQCDIDAAVLALPEKGLNAPTAEESAKDGGVPAGQIARAELRPWCVAVLIGDKDKKLYLFDPLLGLPVPAAKGIVAGKSGELAILPATLDQVIADPKLLERMDPTADAPHWVGKADLKRTVALVEASPLYVEPRAKRMEASLAGERKMVLNAEPSQQAARFNAAGIGDVRMWELPYATLQVRMAMGPAEVFGRLSSYLRFIGIGGGGSLYKGRILHLKGRFFDEKGAIAYYQKARPRTRDAQAQEALRVDQYYKEYVARAKQQGHELTPQQMNQLKLEAQRFFSMCVSDVLLGKVDAAYWLGLIEYEQGQYDSSFNYFVARTLQAAGSAVFWESGAHYNMARCDEMSGRWQDAVRQYDSNARMQNDIGSLVRARWLKEVHEPNPAAESGKPEKKKPEKKKAEEKKPQEKKAEANMPDAKKPAAGKSDEKKPDEKK
jgi:tetratricopeptide (TPR) repeat protein